MKKVVVLSAFCMMFAGSSYAQLTGKVSVEGEYAPIIVDVERLEMAPEVKRMELMPLDLNYEYAGVVTDFRPSLLPMGVTGWNVAGPYRHRHGFVDFRLGSWLNSRLHAGCTLLSDSLNLLQADLKFKSSSLYRMKDWGEDFTRPSRRRLYDGKFGLDFSRLIGEEGLLQASAAYRVNYFNYYGTSVPLSLRSGMRAPTQTLNMVTAAVGYSSSPSFVKGWHASGNVSYSAYRRLYAPVLENMAVKGDAETALSLKGGYAFPINQGSAINIDASGDFLFYGDNRSAIVASPVQADRDYGVIALKPSFRFHNSGIKVQAGLDLSFAYNAMGADLNEDFRAVHLAPDIFIEYKRRGFGLHIKALGGVTPLTLPLLEKFDNYQLPYTISTAPLFTPIDATIGVDFGPFAGFAGAVDFRYAVVRNAPVGGWYQMFLNEVFASQRQDAFPFYDPYAVRRKMHGVGVSLNLRYDYGSKVSVIFNGSYYPSNGIFSGYDTPRWTLEASAEYRPVDKLKVEAGYDFRGARRIYALFPTSEGNELYFYRLSDLHNLHAKVTFSLLKNFDIYCMAENILNRHSELLPGLQQEGVVISGGFYWEF